MPAPSKGNTLRGVTTVLTLIVRVLLRPSIALGQYASAKELALCDAAG